MSKVQNPFMLVNLPASQSSNQKRSVGVIRNGRSALLRGPRIEHAVAGIAFPATGNGAGSPHGLVRCDVTNGAHTRVGKDNNKGVEAILEDGFVNPTTRIEKKPFSKQEKLPSLKQISEIDKQEDLNQLQNCFASIDEAVEAIKEGKFVLVVDDENRENEGDLIMAGSLVTPQAMAFLVKHSTGIVCVAMKGEDLDRLQLPLMVHERSNGESSRTAFTVTVDVKAGTTTGVSAEDRCKSILALASPDSKADAFTVPGHIFPLRYREGGVLKRRGHTEASLDLVTLAGLAPAGVLCEVVHGIDGSMARLPYLKDFARRHGFPLISIDDLVKYRTSRIKNESLVRRTAVARLPTTYGEFQAYSYTSNDGLEHAAIVAGDISSGLDVYVRVHSECLTGDVFGSTRCDCGSQLADSQMFIQEIGRGVVVYMRGHEGRGIGLGHKMRAYNLQDAGCDTVEANLKLGLPVDSREYGISAQILQDLGVCTMTLLSNNPAKVKALEDFGLVVNERRSICSPITKDNRRYVETKRVKMGHIYQSRLPAIGNCEDGEVEVEVTESDSDSLL